MVLAVAACVVVAGEEHQALASFGELWVRRRGGGGQACFNARSEVKIHVVCLEYYWRVSSSSHLIALVGSKWAPGQRVGPVQRAPDVKVCLLPLVRVLHRLVHAALGPRAHRPARGQRKRHHQDHSRDPAEDRQPAAAVRPWFAVALGRGERARGHRVVRAPVLTRFDGKGKASVACGARAFNRWTSKTRGLEFSLAVWKSRLTWFSSHALFCPTAA